ncbi:MAG: septum formation initiator family protein [Acidobacteriota bacterium]
MDFSPKIPDRKAILVVGALLITGVWAVAHGPQGIRTLMEKRQEILAFQKSNAALMTANAQARERICKLTGSESEQEVIIRGDLKLGKKNETIFVLPPQPDDNTTAKDKKDEAEPHSAVKACPQ